MTTVTSDELYRRIVDESTDAIIYADAGGTIQLWNGGAETLFGYTSDEATGESLDLIIPERLRSRHWDGYHKVMATGESRYGPGELLSVPGIKKDGSRVSLEFSISLLRDADDRPIGIAAILRDVTARWEQDRELRQKLAALEAATKQSPS